VDNEGSYMLNKCGSKKFSFVELCDDILVDTALLANFESPLYMFRSFKMFVRDRCSDGHDHARAENLAHARA